MLNEDKKIQLDSRDIIVESSYTGPKLENVDEITPKWCEQLMEWYRDGKTLHKKYAVTLIMKATEIFEKEESVVSILLDDLEEVTVCGDIHG